MIFSSNKTPTLLYLQGNLHVTTIRPFCQIAGGQIFTGTMKCERHSTLHIWEVFLTAKLAATRTTVLGAAIKETLYYVVQKPSRVVCSSEYSKYISFLLLLVTPL